jgi:hypothetical protein
MAIVTQAQVKTFLQITGTDKDDLITALIPAVEADYLRIRNAAFDASGAITLYPDGSDLVASLMIGYNLNSSMASGGAMKSESIGSYSYTRADTPSGYPDAITSRIDKYVSSR